MSDTKEKSIISEWEKHHVFRLEKDRLKAKKFIFTSFPTTNNYGFQTGGLRKYLFADVYSRYYRMEGYNVLYGMGFYNLAQTAFMESKKQVNCLDDTIMRAYESELKALGVGFDKEKEIDMLNDKYLLFIQKAFLDLYHQKRIQFKKKECYYIKETNKILNDFEVIETPDGTICKKGLNLVNKKEFKVLVLDISNIQGRIANDIITLDLESDKKQELLDALKPSQLLHVDLYTTTGVEISLVFQHPELMGAFNYLALNPKLIDVSKYIDSDELEIIEEFFASTSPIPGVFSGSLITNPLTGVEIPIFISTKFDEAIHIGYSYQSEEDTDFSNALDLDTYPILEDDILVNSDFLSGLKLDEARNQIIDTFVSEGMGSIETVYNLKEIIISSLDNFGALIPLYKDLTQDDIYYPLDNHIPITFSSKFRPQIYDMDTIEEIGNLTEGSLNSLFTLGLAPFAIILYDHFVGVQRFFSLEAVNELNEFSTPEVLLLDTDSLFSGVFMPTIFINLLKMMFPSLNINVGKNIIFEGVTKDYLDNELSKRNNNFINIDKALSEYPSDALRLYFLSNEISSKMNYNFEEIQRFNQYIQAIKRYFNTEFVEESFGINYSLHQLVKTCNKCLESLDIVSYIEVLMNFYKDYLLNNQITKAQAKDYIKLLSIVAPFTGEIINEDSLGDSSFIIDEDYPK